MRILYFWAIVFLLFLSFTFVGVLWVSGSGDDDDLELEQVPETPFDISETEWVYGKIEYRDDVLKPNLYFVLLRAHPGSPVPNIKGGYHTTDVHVTLKLRGVEVPRGLQQKSERNRPHRWLQRERERWDRAMNYVWSVCNPNRTFRVHNLEIVESDKVLEGDVEFLLGGQWHLLSVSMLNDFLVLPAGGDWDFGGLEFGTVNPNIPK